MAQHVLKLANPIRTARLAAGSPSGPSQPPAPQPVAQPTTAGVDDGAARQIVQALQQIAMRVEAVVADQQQSWQQVRSVAIELAVTIAEQLVWQTLQEERHDVEQLVMNAIQHADEPQRIKILLHPADFALVQQHVEAATQQTWKDANVQLVTDASIARGNCLADMEHVATSFDWRLQLSEIKQRLLHGSQDERPEYSRNETSR